SIRFSRLKIGHLIKIIGINLNFEHPILIDGLLTLRNFAITLALGIVTSIFAGVIVSGLLSESLYSQQHQGGK
ncbi:hypothetical protein, partial [Pseudoalteromonas sp. PS5]|uniref:hypothetical protein n=1 Tax=Pseudoalteromonas sp. PS5 TaxID=1437473 RepID=UPI001025ADFA